MPVITAQRDLTTKLTVTCTWRCGTLVKNHATVTSVGKVTQVPACWRRTRWHTLTRHSFVTYVGRAFIISVTWHDTSWCTRTCDLTGVTPVDKASHRPTTCVATRRYTAVSGNSAPSVEKNTVFLRTTSSENMPRGCRLMSCLLQAAWSPATTVGRSFLTNPSWGFTSEATPVRSRTAVTSGERATIWGISSMTTTTPTPAGSHTTARYANGRHLWVPTVLPAISAWSK